MQTKDVLEAKVVKLEALVKHKQKLVQDRSTSAQSHQIEQINELAATGRQIKRMQAAKDRLTKALQMEDEEHPSISLEKLTKLRFSLKKRTTDLENDEYVGARSNI